MLTVLTIAVYVGPIVLVVLLEINQRQVKKERDAHYALLCEMHEQQKQWRKS
jgi:hypothetical protein